MLISVVTLALLIIAGLTLYKDTSLSFTNDGYIIESSSKVNKKYYFSANTKYKENVDEKITFSDKESNKVAVDPASFVHYLNGNIAFLQRGAMVNLSEITSPMVSYYNINNENVITSENGGYTVTSNNKKINIESFVGRISDSKYIVAGKDLSLKLPQQEERITSDYFELLFIEEGIVKIDNQEKSYQVTAQDSYIYVGNNITISLGDGKIFYDGTAKMLLSQITINGDENINLDVEKNKNDNNGEGGGNGIGSGDGTGEGEGFGDGDNSNIDNSGEYNTPQEGTTSTTGDKTTDSPQIELIEAQVSATTIDLSMQLNNAALANGKVVAYLTNVQTGSKESPKTIELVNGTFKLNYGSLAPTTEYSLTIVEIDIANEKQYFQKTFKTKDLGLALEKVYATDDSLSYKVLFDENAEVSRVHISIYDNNGTNDKISPNEFIVSKEDLDTGITFTGLKSNTSYSINVDIVWINNTAYTDLYTIDRIDSTLKKAPSISNIDIDTNTEEVKFTIKLNKIIDPDKSIISYTYNIYLADDVNLENSNPEVRYSITKNDSDSLILNLNEIDELKTGVDYRCKIIAQYNDNEMIREVSTEYSQNFLIRSKPNITWELESTSMNKVVGTVSLMDANCTVPVNGRTCSNENNNFTIRYYKLKEQESSENDRNIYFDSKTLSTKITLSDLASNTTYAVKVFGNYYDDENILHTNVQIGDTFFVTTDKSENIHFEILGDNTSGKNKDGTTNSANVVTFDAKLTAPQNSTIQQEISTITFNLYSGRYNVKEKLIGTYKITDKAEIEDLFSNITIKNALFTDTTKNKFGKLDSLEKLIQVTNNSTGTLNGSYTVEVEDVYDSTGRNKITVENNIYTFNLTPSYYLDTRIETNPKDQYITVTPITKENLNEAEYKQLSKTVSNLDALNDDTIVGVTIENSLSDIFVDSAFTYEKVVVDYIIYNETTKKEIKRISIDMGNKYQPKTQTVYLDSSELDDGKKYFTRGYKYKFSYSLNFITEDGSNPVYTNDRLNKTVAIERQAPIYTQYISTSNSEGITYRYSFSDIDKALFDQNFYYTLGEDDATYSTVENTLIADKNTHEVTIPIAENTEYKLYYARKNTSDKLEYIKFTNYTFEKEYHYNNENTFSIIDDNDNTLKLKLENTEITDRAAAYKVVISAVNQNDITNYTRYFLASKLNIISEDTGEFDEAGNKITKSYKYIGIDYANISRFMGSEMKISVYSYYDSGLVGFDQEFKKGLILKNNQTNKYLNIYNSGSDKASSVKQEAEIMGINFLKEPYAKEDKNMSLYNQLMDTANYNPLLGASYYDTIPSSSNIGINYNVSVSNAGIILSDGKTDYLGYDARVLNEANLKAKKNTYQFDTIIPSITVTSGINTINSIKINITAQGIYGNKQFVKDGASHNKMYIEVYSDENLEHKLTSTPLTTDIHISGNDDIGYSAIVDSIEYKNLIPATKYYFTVSAYIDGEYTRLFDSASKNSYLTKVYSSSTLDTKGLLSSLKWNVDPKRYKGESSEKEISWRIGLKNTDNYKLRFELYEPAGTSTKIDPENGEEETITNYKPVNLDGSQATSCDTNTSGTDGNGYVSNCYISVAKEAISTINNQNQTYKFTGNDFVFGGHYYKLVVYAIPYTNGNYKEDQKLLLYQNDSLTTLGTTGIETVDGIQYNIKIPTLEEATFSLNNTLTSGHTEKDGYYISFVPVITDNNYVIKYGTYTVKLKDEKGNVINQKTGIDASEINPQSIKFTGLSSNTLYYVELSYETYRNNIGFTDSQKTDATPFTDFTYTPVDAGITLGTITAGQSSAKNVILTYNGSANLSENITRVHYTISLKGGSSKTTGDYKIDKDHPNIFTIATDKTPKLIIDTSDSDYSTNTSFSFKSGNTYIITTQYYYMVNGVETLLTDQETLNTTYTTILNL